MMKNIQKWSLYGVLLMACSCASVKVPFVESSPEDAALDAYKVRLVDSSKVVLTQLGAEDGFFGNDSVAIVIPEVGARIEEALRGIGLGELPDNVILSMNRVAESATRKITPALLSDISSISRENIKKMQHSSSVHPLCDYLSEHSEVKLKKQLKAYISDQLDAEGTNGAWNNMFTRYSQMPFIIGKESGSITDYVTQCTLDGIYYTLAASEAKVPKDL